MIRYDIRWYDTSWYGMIFNDNDIKQDMIWYDVIMVWYDIIWYNNGMIW